MYYVQLRPCQNLAPSSSATDLSENNYFAVRDLLNIHYAYTIYNIHNKPLRRHPLNIPGGSGFTYNIF